MQKIRLKGNHFNKVLLGATSVVRLSKLTPELGPALLHCENVPPHDIAIIIDCVRIIHFENLNAFDVHKAGFKSLRHLRHELEQFYDRKITDRDAVKVIDFFIDKEDSE